LPYSYYQTYLLLSFCDCQSQQNEEMIFSKSELVGKNRTEHC
jgi:hypothetical protein